MKLDDLGFDAFFRDEAEKPQQPGLSPARVTAVDRGGGLVRNEHREVPFELSGKLEYGARSAVDLPCVGDWVCVQYHNDGASAIVHEVLTRKTFLRRKRAGNDVDFQMIAANIDVAFIVQSCHYDFNLHRLDRYLVMANEGHIEPVVILTKIDLVTPGNLAQTIASIAEAGITARVHALSNATGAGLEEFRQLLAPGMTYCLLGSSGVGKTTLINRLVGRDAFDTKPVSGTGEGMHSTSRRHLIVLEAGAMLIDTPGMRELGILGAGVALDDSFTDIRDLGVTCRYADCSHVHELGCSVLAAIESGRVTQDRYDNYLKLRKESEFHEMSYVEKRRKDRAFGKLVRTVKKTMKKDQG